MKQSYDFYIGIDPGKHTGIAVWNSKERRFDLVRTVNILEAMEIVSSYSADKVLVIFEDARKRKWYGENSEFKRMGAGSVKRDCDIWETFLNMAKVPFMAIMPRRGLTKIDAKKFMRLTGFDGRTSSHARDAAMLVFGR